MRRTADASGITANKRNRIGGALVNLPFPGNQTFRTDASVILLRKKSLHCGSRLDFAQEQKSER
jgi:hypothetical protein